MLRPAASAVTLVAAMLVFCAAEAAAANPAPNPPPGSVGIQPTSVSAGSSSQPGSGTTISTGQAGASSDGQNGTVTHCGVQAGSAGAGYSAQPTSAGTSGTGTSTCNASSGNAAAGNGAQITSYGQGAAAGRSGSGSPTSSAFGDGDGMATKQRLLSLFTGDALNSDNGGWNWLSGLIWLGLQLLLALFFVLVEVAIGRRRRAPVAA